MVKKTNLDGIEGYFMTEEEYQSMLNSQERIETMLMKMGAILE